MWNSSIILLLLGLILVSCKEIKGVESVDNLEITEPSFDDNSIKTTHLDFVLNGKKYRPFLAFKDNEDDNKPFVFIFPEWWGMTDYIKYRAQQVADLGYITIAIDMFGDGSFVTTPDEAKEQTALFYEKPELAKEIFNATRNLTRNLSEGDSTRMATMGYCFGGAMSLNIARAEEPILGAVSFHGGLKSKEKINTDRIKILVLNGADDKNISEEEIEDFMTEMKNAEVDLTFISYPKALHSFTNPEATQIGRRFNMNIAYNEEADKASWKEMKNFFKEIFDK